MTQSKWVENMTNVEQKYRFDFDEDFMINQNRIAAEELYSYILSHESDVIQLYKDPQVFRDKISKKELSRNEITEILECIEQKIR